MAFTFNPYTVIMVGSALLAFGLIPTTIKNRDKPGAVPLAFALLFAGHWALVYGLQIASTTMSTKLFLNNLRYAGPAFMTVSFFFLAVEYTGQERWRSMRSVAMLSIVPLTITTAVWIPELEPLIREDVSLVQHGSLQFLDVALGPLFWVHGVHSYLMLAAGTVLLGIQFGRRLKVGVFRGQTATLMLAAIVPWIVNVLYLTDVTTIDYTPASFSVFGLFVAVALFRYRLFNIVPIGRDRAVETIDEGYVVLDARDRIIDVNTQAKALLDVEDASLEGQSVTDAFERAPALIDEIRPLRDSETRVTVTLDDETRHIEANVSSIYDDTEQYVGRVIILRDVTQRVQRQAELSHQTAALERQNKRLERFAEVVSHDIRNPINIVQAHVELAMEADTADREPHHDKIEANVEEMQHIIDEMLTLTDQEESVATVEVASLRTLCKESWAKVETDGATLAIDSDRHVEADRARVRQILENLFRDAVQRGGSDVTVTVGDLDSGFYVADDGPGIDPTYTEQVFEEGFSTDPQGTEFGLWIVKNAVESHGWTIALEERSQGGTRFEIRGVDDPKQ
jgi:PAS domain S-box-containing protein